MVSFAIDKNVKVVRETAIDEMMILFQIPIYPTVEQILFRVMLKLVGQDIDVLLMKAVADELVTSYIEKDYLGVKFGTFGVYVHPTTKFNQLHRENITTK